MGTFSTAGIDTFRRLQSFISAKKRTNGRSSSISASIMDSQIEYEQASGAASLDERIRSMCEKIGQREAARSLGVSRMTVGKVLLQGCHFLTRSIRERIARLGSSESKADADGCADLKISVAPIPAVPTA
jgi:hypothetical protein